MSLSVTQTQPDLDTFASREHGQWTLIPQQEVDDWNRRLVATDAHFRQYPYWHEPYRQIGARVYYLVYKVDAIPIFYAAMVLRGWTRLPFGLVQRGPVSLIHGVQPTREILMALGQVAKSLGCIGLRFTHSDPQVMQLASSLPGSVRRELCPFYRDPPRSLFVIQHESDAATQTAFQPVARREIKAAIRAGYEIRVSDAPDALADAWPMLESLASSKKFKLSDRPRSGWLEMMEIARRHDCARLYSACLNGRCVEHILVARYGAIAEYLLGALDVAALHGAPSPSCLIHWTAMREFYRQGCTVYNLGGPGNVNIGNTVYQFKRKFRPTLFTADPPVTLALRPAICRLWIDVCLRTFSSYRFVRCRLFPLKTLPARVAARLQRVLRPTSSLGESET